MTEGPIVYGPLSSLIDRDDQVDLELACLSNMSITVIMIPNIKFTRSNWIFLDLFDLKKDEIDEKNTNTSWLQSTVQA
jgi:hypothetical protein